VRDAEESEPALRSREGIKGLAAAKRLKGYATIVRIPRLGSLLLAGTLAITAHADPAPFDLAGPSLEVRVTRGAQTLPVAEVPNLMAGDRVWIKSDLPATQSTHYLLVAAFLRGSTNPPPVGWFFPCKTWVHQCAQEGLTVTVPQDAQQMLVFLAPETGGDYKTLINAVRGRPGAFVRASQDLNQATLDRSRLESYLSAIRALDQADPTRLKESTPLLARSLAIKVDEKCLDKIPELQAPCLMQGQESLILNDGHSTSIVEALTAGPTSDLAMEASYTPQLRYGYYSPYVASVLDIARIMGSFTTAQYQYIPALVSQHGDQLALTLNTAPSFHDPKSVLVAALPAVEQPQLPPLHAVNPKETFCARKTALVLPVEGAPLVFSTGYAHEVALSLSAADGKTISLSAKPDAERGGFVIDTSGLRTAELGDNIRGSLHGYWGFDQFDGPGFQLLNSHAQTWELDAKDAGKLIVGREGTVHLQASSVECVDGIMLKDPGGKELRADWKLVKSNEVEVKLPLQEATPGSITLLVGQYGASQPQAVQLHAFSEAGHLDGFGIHAGESSGILKGTRLDEVAGLVMKNILFVPGKLSTSATGDELSMEAPDVRTTAALRQGESVKAKVTLKDGRVIALNASVEPPRPSVVLIGKSVQLSSSGSDSNIRLANPGELPQGAILTFSLHAQAPPAFSHDEQIEVATADESFSQALSLANGGITLENTKVAVATLDPAKAFGPSAFGPLQFRVTVNGVASEWQPLATLVRLPVLKDLQCPSTAALACKLSGSNLFLIDSVSGDAQFSNPVQVPDGFPGYAMPVPHPTDGRLYVKLRDDPSVVNPASLAPQQLPPSPDEAARALVRQAAVHNEEAPVVNSDGSAHAAISSTQRLPARQVAPSQDAPAQPQQQTEPAPDSRNGAATQATNEPALQRSN
jgi:hypothetical protein